MGKRRTEEEIEGLLGRYDARGNVTRRVFCENEGVALATLGYYLQRRTKLGVRLARVKLTSETLSGERRFALVLTNGRRIECGLAELEHLINAAERA